MKFFFSLILILILFQLDFVKIRNASSNSITEDLLGMKCSCQVEND